MLAVGVGGIQIWKSRTRVGFPAFLWGGLAWITGVTAKAIAALTSSSVEGVIRHLLPAFSVFVLCLYTGLLTGVFECGATLLFARAVARLRRASWSEAVGFGIGFGATEAILVAAVSLALVGLRLGMPNIRTELPVEYQNLAAPGSPAEYLTPALERVGAIIVHAFAAALIVHTVRTKAWRWFWLAFAYKTAVDALPVEILANGSLRMLLVPYLPFFIVGVAGTWVLKKCWTKQQANYS